MPNNEKSDDLARQPLMSTGTTEPGFKKGRPESKVVSKPKIGETVMGEKGV